MKKYGKCQGPKSQVQGRSPIVRDWRIMRWTRSAPKHTSHPGHPVGSIARSGDAEVNRNTVSDQAAQVIRPGNVSFLPGPLTEHENLSGISAYRSRVRPGTLFRKSVPLNARSIRSRFAGRVYSVKRDDGVALLGGVDIEHFYRAPAGVIETVQIEALYRGTFPCSKMDPPAFLVVNNAPLRIPFLRGVGEDVKGIIYRFFFVFGLGGKLRGLFRGAGKTVERTGGTGAAVVFLEKSRELA